MNMRNTLFYSRHFTGCMIMMIKNIKKNFSSSSSNRKGKYLKIFLFFLAIL